jgi:hypothetical protein
MAKGIKAAPRKRKKQRLSEHARLVEERARSIPPRMVHELFDTSALPVPPPAPARHTPRGRLVSKPPPPPPRPSHRPEGVEAEFADLEDLEEGEELEELEELEVSEESQTDGFGSHTVPPALGTATGVRRPWQSSRMLPLLLGVLVVGGLALATVRELGRSRGAAPREAKAAPAAATDVPKRTVAPPPAPSPGADDLPRLPPGVTEPSSASPASEVVEGRSATKDASNAAVVAVSPDAVSVAASNAVLPQASKPDRARSAVEPAPTAAFDVAAADAAIDAAFQRARGCRSASDPKGVATVALTYAPSGRTTTALVSGIFAGTSTGSCIAAALRSARIQPFTGTLVTVKRSAKLE